MSVRCTEKRIKYGNNRVICT